MPDASDLIFSVETSHTYSIIIKIDYSGLFHVGSLPGLLIVVVVIFLGFAMQPLLSMDHPSSDAYGEVLGASKYTFSVSSGDAAR